MRPNVAALTSAAAPSPTVATMTPPSGGPPSWRADRSLRGPRRVNVIDAGVIVELVAGDLDPGRLGDEELIAPHLLDSEVPNLLRRLVLRGALTEEQGALGFDGFTRDLSSVAEMSDLESPEPVLPSFDESWSRALCVVAHPDDLEYGVSAAVDRWVQQEKTVTYLLATYGEAGIDGVPPTEAASLRAQEERDGAAEVGVEVVEFLGYDDGMVEYGLPLRRDFARAVRIHRPEVVITLTHRERFAGGGTNQADHRAVGLAALDASKDAGNRWIHPELATEGYEPWSGVKWVCMMGSPEQTHGVDVTGHMDAAVASLEAHHAYLEALGEDYPSPPDLLAMILGAGGKAMGVKHAVTFEVFDI